MNVSTLLALIPSGDPVRAADRQQLVQKALADAPRTESSGATKGVQQIWDADCRPAQCSRLVGHALDHGGGGQIEGVEHELVWMFDQTTMKAIGLIAEIVPLGLRRQLLEDFASVHRLAACTPIRQQRARGNARQHGDTESSALPVVARGTVVRHSADRPPAASSTRHAPAKLSPHFR